MKATDIIDIVEHKIRNGSAVEAPTFLYGAPGVGKSDVVRQIAERVKDILPGDLIDVRAVLLDAVDVRGIPHVVTNDDGTRSTVWVPPGFLPSADDKPGILFLDELPNAAPMVQSALLQLVLDRELGEYKLPDGWVIVAAGNRVEDRAGSNRVIKSLCNRFGSHITFEVSVEDWQSWAVKHDVDDRVRSFINFRPALIHSFDPKSDENAFASPRSWAMLSAQLKEAPKRMVFPIASSCVGEGAAAEFVAFVETYADLPDLDAIVSAPDDAPCDIVAPATLYALCGALGQRAKAGKKDAVAVARYATRLPAEFAVLALREIVPNQKFVTKDPAVTKWLQKNRNLLGMARKTS